MTDCYFSSHVRKLHFKQQIHSPVLPIKTRKRAKIRNQYNQAPHLTQDTNGKVTTSQLDITNENRAA